MAVDDDAANVELITPSADTPNAVGAKDVDAEPADVVVGDPAGLETDGAAAGTERPDSSVHRSGLRPTLITGAAVFVALAALAGWNGYGAYQSHRETAQDEQFVAVARQGAVNLTTIDYEHADDDVKRILDSATGTFYDDFDKRAEPFLEVVKKVQSKSVGTVVDAGLESQSGDTAQVLVAVNVKTTVGDGTTQDPRSWRMRISVQKIADHGMKVSDVAFVP